jgi:Glycosyltransferase family 9 (heptosyltransferase)
MRLYDESFHPGIRLQHIAARFIAEKRNGDAIVAALGACHFNPDKLEPYTVLSAAYDQIRGCEKFQIAAAEVGLDLPADNKDPYNRKMRADLHHNMALAQNRLYQWDAAIRSANMAHHLNPENPWHLGHAAQIADEMGNSEQAKLLVSGAINLIESEGNPYNDGKPVSEKFRREMYLARSISSLNLGDYPVYFQDFESRLKLTGAGDTLAPKLYCEGRLWRPGQYIGPNVFVILEQGLGDQIEFARLAHTFRMANPQIQRMTAHCHPVVSDVIRSTGWFDGGVYDARDFEVPHDYYTSIASLDLIRWAYESGLKDIFGAWQGPYVHIKGRDQIKREHPTKKTAIGFCWQGNPDHVYDWARSVPYEAFIKWAESKRNVCTFHSLQHGKKLIEFPEWIDDCDRQTYAELAEVVNACDVIVGPDTGVMHLAGAMGKPAVMLHTVCRDWRWRLPIKIYGNNFRHLVQKKPGDWTELLSRLGPELDGLLNTVEMAELTQAMAR